MSNCDKPQNFSIHFNNFLIKTKNMLLYKFYKNLLIENMSVNQEKKYTISCTIFDIGNRKRLFGTIEKGLQGIPKN